MWEIQIILGTVCVGNEDYFGTVCVGHANSFWDSVCGKYRLFMGQCVWEMKIIFGTVRV